MHTSFFLDYVCHNVKVLAAIPVKIWVNLADHSLKLAPCICNCPTFVFNCLSHSRLLHISYILYILAVCYTYFLQWDGQLAVYSSFSKILIGKDFYFLINWRMLTIIVQNVWCPQWTMRFWWCIYWLKTEWKRVVDSPQIVQKND